MFRNAFFAVGATTIYLVLYCILLRVETSIALLMLLFAPLVMVWMVITVLKDGPYKGKELGDDEFGYQDRNKEELDVF